MIKTQRLILRKWQISDAESLYNYAKDPDVGPIADWNAHKNIEESLEIIKNVLCAKECYAICEKQNNVAIGAIELKLNGFTDMTQKDNECELGFWLGKPFWGKGYMLEAAQAILKRAFTELSMQTVWGGYYEGNTKSKRVQEKIGFTFHHTCNNVAVPLLNEERIGHTNIMTKQMWEKLAIVGK